MTTVETLPFGLQLRRRRVAAGLTQEELAARANVSARAISDMERRLRRRPRRDTVELLAEALGLAPDERAAFERAARMARAIAGSVSAGESDAEPEQVLSRPAVRPSTPPSNLPAFLTPLVGRERDEAAAARLLSQPDARLVTLTGPAGIGKTRLAIQVAAGMHASFGDGICFVDLSSVRDPGLVLPSIAQALWLPIEGSLPVAESLRLRLRDKQVLLLLDNFEQVVAAAPEVAGLLAACPHLKVLVTSRATLRVRGEHELAVPPLALPDPTHPVSTADLGHYAAVALFLQRARAARPSFVLTADNADAIAALCRRLDGLPLAIELAAVRLKLFSPHALMARLEQGWDVLRDGPRDLPERQRTLERAIRWSYELLDTAEQALFRRLAVFAGDWTLEAAQAICVGYDGREGAESAQDGILDVLGALVDKSLVRQDETADGQPRFSMLETIRAFALDRLAASGEGETLRRRHAEYYLALAQAPETPLRGREQAVWLERLQAEHGNLRTALRWARESGEVGLGFRLIDGSWRYWVARAPDEGRMWLEELLARDTHSGQPGTPARTRALGLLAVGYFALQQGDFAAARAYSEEAAALFRHLDDPGRLAFALDHLAMALSGQGGGDHAVDLWEEALALHSAAANEWGTAAALYHLGTMHVEMGAYALAASRLEESLRLDRALEDTVGIALNLQQLGTLCSRRGEHERALTYFQESLSLLLPLGRKMNVAQTLSEVAAIAAMRGQVPRAVQLYGRASATREAIGASPAPSEQVRDERDIVALRAALGDAAFERAWAEGRTLPLEAALAEVEAVALA